jgi:hypothetical protein
MPKYLLLLGAPAILASTAACVGCNDYGNALWC